MPSGFNFEHQDLEIPDWISTEVEFSISSSILDFEEETIASKLEISEPLMRKEIKTEIFNVRERTKQSGTTSLF